MHVDPLVAVAGFIVGLIVGTTGMGGGALMTPILILLFKVQPLAAVSSDLVASMVMKPFGSAIHVRRGTVRKELVGWLSLGSLPAAFAGVFLIRLIGNDGVLQQRLKVTLGIVLLVAALAIVAKSYLQRRGASVASASVVRWRPALPIKTKRVATVLVGAVGGLAVGMTSVGSGSLIIVALMLLYPLLSSSELVGTDLVQAVPLVAAAAVAHVLFGDFRVGITASILVGSIPGVLIGAAFSSRAPDPIVRSALLLVLSTSGLKLANVSNAAIGLVIIAAAVAAGAYLAITRLPRANRLSALEAREREAEAAEAI